jgi:hypothetical protein
MVGGLGTLPLFLARLTLLGQAQLLATVGPTASASQTLAINANGTAAAWMH